MSKRIVTHSGSYHTDDVFAVGVLLMVFPDAEVVRSRDPEIVNAADIAVDVSREYNAEKMRFDHHQEGGAGIRPNGIPYASFGLVWKEFGEKLAGSNKVQEVIDRKLAQPIDAIDNGVNISKYMYGGVRDYSISDFLFSLVDESNKDEAYLSRSFMELVTIAKDLVVREISKAQKQLEETETVRQIVSTTQDKRIIILDKDMPWREVLEEVPESLYVIYPRAEGNWGVKAVRKQINSFEPRKALPEHWRGKDKDELIAITGVPDAIFCHKSGHLVAAQSKESAIRLASMALEA